MKRVPIADRIRAAMGGRTTQRYWDVLIEVFPHDQYPHAMNYQQNGGPPGCSMAFNKAVRLLGGTWSGMGAARTVYVPLKAS